MEVTQVLCSDNQTQMEKKPWPIKQKTSIKGICRKCMFTVWYVCLISTDKNTIQIVSQFVWVYYLLFVTNLKKTEHLRSTNNSAVHKYTLTIVIIHPPLLKSHMIILQLVLPALPVAPPSIQPHYTLWADAFVFEPSPLNTSISSLLPRVRNWTCLTLLQCHLTLGISNIVTSTPPLQCTPQKRALKTEENTFELPFQCFVLLIYASEHVRKAKSWQ